MNFWSVYKFDHYLFPAQQAFGRASLPVSSIFPWFSLDFLSIYIFAWHFSPLDGLRPCFSTGFWHFPMLFYGFLIKICMCLCFLMSGHHRFLSGHHNFFCQDTTAFFWSIFYVNWLGHQDTRGVFRLKSNVTPISSGVLPSSMSRFLYIMLQSWGSKVKGQRSLRAFSIWKNIEKQRTTTVTTLGYLFSH